VIKTLGESASFENLENQSTVFFAGGATNREGRYIKSQQ